MTNLILGKEIHEDVEMISTGISSLDSILGGGLPKGRIIEVFGRESTGKSALAQTVVATAQKQGMKCLWADAEQSFDFAFAEKLGVQPDKVLFVKTELGYGEEYLSAVEDAIKNKKAEVIVIDSLDALTPRAKMEAELLTGVIGIKAKMLSEFCRRVVHDIKKNKVVLIVLNQTRVNFVTGQDETPGGFAMRFYTSVRLKMRPSKVLTSGDTLQGKKIIITVVKNKVANPGGVTETNFLFESGFSETGDVLDVALKEGVLHKEGNAIMFGDIKLGRGLNAAREFLESNTDIQEQISAKLS